MTIAVLYPTDPRSDVFYEGAFPVDEPSVVIVGGPDLLADGDDSTYVEVDAGFPALHHAPRFSAHFPALPNVASINSLTLAARLESFDNAYSAGDPRLSYRLQVFRYYPSTTMPDPYRVEDTSTLWSVDNSLQIQTTFGDFSHPIPTFDIAPADLESGELWFRYQYMTFFGETGTHRAAAVSLTVDYEPSVITPLRQVGRPSAARQYPPVSPSRQVGRIP